MCASGSFFFRAFIDHLHDGKVRTQAYACTSYPMATSDVIALCAIQEPLGRILRETLGGDSGLYTRSVFCRLTTGHSLRGQIAKRSKASTVRTFVGATLKFGPRGCGVTSNDNISICGCVSPHLLLRCLGCTCCRQRVFLPFCRSLPVTKISNALRGQVGRAGTHKGIRTGANSMAKIDSLTNCMGTTSKRRLTFIVVGRGMLGLDQTHTFRSGFYSVLSH